MAKLINGMLDVSSPDRDATVDPFELITHTIGYYVLSFFAWGLAISYLFRALNLPDIAGSCVIMGLPLVIGIVLWRWMVSRPHRNTKPSICLPAALIGITATFLVIMIIQGANFVGNDINVDTTLLLLFIPGIIIGWIVCFIMNNEIKRILAVEHQNAENKKKAAAKAEADRIAEMARQKQREAARAQDLKRKQEAEERRKKEEAEALARRQREEAEEASRRRTEDLSARMVNSEGVQSIAGQLALRFQNVIDNMESNPYLKQLQADMNLTVSEDMIRYSAMQTGITRSADSEREEVLSFRELDMQSLADKESIRAAATALGTLIRQKTSELNEKDSILPEVTISRDSDNTFTVHFSIPNPSYTGGKSWF